MRIDLHAHTTCSNGTDTPTELVEEAKAADLDVLAVTDHDTTDGWAEGRRRSRPCRHPPRARNRAVHEEQRPKPASARLRARPGRPRPDRDAVCPTPVAPPTDTRDPRQAPRPRVQGHRGRRRKHAGDGTIGRAHIADALVAASECTDRRDAFDRLLGYGGGAYVARYSPTIEDAIAAINHAGGAAVVAHPWGRETHITEERFAELAACGMAGIEVDHEEHDDAAREQLRAVATNLDLIITGSSDHHGTGKDGHSLGCNTTHPDQLERLIQHTRISGVR